jgi:DNA invertase Pin-like site-specific DNA recombinase
MGFKMREIIGYCRVSTDGQTLQAEMAELRGAGATKIFAEKQSGARSDRPQLRRALAALGEGDTLVVTRLDRLARSTRDLLNVLHEVAQSGAAPPSVNAVLRCPMTKAIDGDDERARLEEEIRSQFGSK